MSSDVTARRAEVVTVLDVSPGSTVASDASSAVAAGRTVAAPLARHRNAIARRLSDLLRQRRPDDSYGVYLTDRDAAVAARSAGYDPLLYTAYRDILPPRRLADTVCYSDLVVFEPGELPGGELIRSIGHWNTPAQLEVFQVLSGRVLMLTAHRSASGPRLRYQVCGPGDMAAMPFGGWHLTSVLDGPAVVYNLYADLPGLAQQHSSRDAADDETMKYGSGELVELTACHDDRGVAIVGSPEAVRTWGTATAALPVDGLTALVGAVGLPAFCARAAPSDLVHLGNLAMERFSHP